MTDKPVEKMRVLLSAYACEPDKGSEPGVGWTWACGLADKVDLTILTRESNRALIERAVAASAPDSPVRRARFIYFDLGGFALWLKRKKVLGTFAYYVLWQRAVARRFAETADAMDVVHHLTFCSLLCPGLWRLRRAASVIGPVGAPLIHPEYVRLFGSKAWQQRVRDRVLRNFRHLPWLGRVLSAAAVVVPANSETAGLLRAQGVRAAEVILDTGAPNITVNPCHNRNDRVRFLFAGKLERRKGLELSLRALAKVLEQGANAWEFRIIGDGPDRPRLEIMAAALGLPDHVTFTGVMDQQAVWREMGEADVFLFTSVRDTSAGVNLEAMALGLPVVCLSHQGVADITDESCAERVPPGPIPETIEALATSIAGLLDNPSRRTDMGIAARQRALEVFNWEGKFIRMVNHYRRAANRSGHDCPKASET